jgi:hypothetical protein
MPCDCGATVELPFVIHEHGHLAEEPHSRTKEIFSMRLLSTTFFAFLLVLFATGCTRSPGGVAASNIPVPANGYVTIGPVAASDCKVKLLGLIPISGSNYLHGAMKKALRKESNADALIDITVDRVSKYFILWSQTCTEVRGMAVRIDRAG